jgi:hypothetical protein
MMTVTCGAGLCNGACAAGFADCNGNKLTDGCETATTTTTNCGGCGNGCVLNNASADACTGTKCTYTCLGGFLDCNVATAPNLDGCEVNSQTDANNCGNCNQICSSMNMATRTCGSGACNGMCATNFGDCDLNKLTNGCETNLLTTAANCGVCGNNCAANNAGHACVSGSCGCNSALDCPASIANACTSPNCMCGLNPACNAATQQCVSGACLLLDGQTCSTGGQCATGHCEKTQAGALVCNAAACGLCQVAAANGSACVTEGNGGDVKGDCAGNNNGHVCEAGACGCGGTGDCNATTANACATTCKCGLVAACNPATSQCSGGACLLNNGQTCTSGPQCATGHCEKTQAGTLVCNAAACGTCQVAAANGSGCGNETDGGDVKGDCGSNNNGHVCEGGACGCASSANCPAAIADTCTGTSCTCGGGAECNGTTQQCSGGSCKGVNGQPCTSGCVSGNCETTQTGSMVCCANACGTCSVCQANGSACTPASNGTDPKTDCGASNSGHTCEAGACGCGSNADCPNGKAPFCTASSRCGCGTAGTVCSATQLCTAYDATGTCLLAPGQTCATNVQCASTQSNACGPGMACKTMAAGQPCTSNPDCQSNACSATGC